MSVTEFTPVLPTNTMRCGIYQLTDTKLQALIEDSKRLVSKNFSGDTAYADAKQWIKDNL